MDTDQTTCRETPRACANRREALSTTDSMALRLAVSQSTSRCDFENALAAVDFSLEDANDSGSLEDALGGRESIPQRLDRGRRVLSEPYLMFEIAERPRRTYNSSRGVVVSRVQQDTTGS